MPGQTSETRMSMYILEALEDGQAKDNDQIRNWIEQKRQLGDTDLLAQNERPYDKWYQTANNALTDGRGLYKLGHVERVGRGLHKITSAGKASLADTRKWQLIFEESNPPMP